MDPRTVAGLASRRTYPLRSSFAPSYNMAVNLTASLGRERAREVLNQSFAQFTIDKTVVKASRADRDRRREIAVRRVMGASRGEILAMFNRRYVMLVAVCFVLAVPVSIWAVRHWLAGFAYAVPLYWWVFALALAGVLAVTALTVTVRSWRAVNENPAESVKSE